jgi:hypothetical protein
MAAIALMSAELLLLLLALLLLLVMVAVMGILMEFAVSLALTAPING